jgi:hypothetical protein
MADLTASALSWTRDLDKSGPEGNMIRSLVTLTITVANATDTWPTGGLALPALRQVGLQNVKAVRGLPAVIDFSGDMDGQIPVIDFSTATAPTMDLYKPGTAKFDPNNGAPAFGAGGVAAHTVTFELLGDAG